MVRVSKGKYDRVIPGLSKLPPADPSWQDQVDEYKQLITDRTPTSLAEKYGALRSEKDDYMAALSALNVQVEAYEQLLAASQENGEDGWGSYGVLPNALRLPSGATVRINPEPYGLVRDKEAFRQWCIANGYERQLQLWPATTGTIVKERLLAGDPPPDGCDVFIKTKVKFSKSGASE